MDFTNRRTPSALLFWVVCIVILAVVAVAFWDTFVVFVAPVIDAVRDTYF
jgi:hypothetical protein